MNRSLRQVTYEFERPTGTAVEVRRIVVERLDHALEQLRGEPLKENRTLAVHTARKDLKKVRSAMRLAKGSMTPDSFRAGNGQLRDAAHELAAIRESDAMAGALSKLIEEFGHMSGPCTEAAQAWGRRLRPSKASPGATADVGRAAAIIERVRDDARLWALGYGSWDIIEPGVRRTYRNGLAGLERAETDSGDEALHEWRKRVKDMWYSLRLLQPMWPEALGAVAEEAHAVSELLGDHHDLGDLVLVIEAGDSGLTRDAGAELVVHARAKQARLRDAAIVKGRRLYAERPRRYSDRLGSLWQCWESQR